MKPFILLVLSLISSTATAGRPVFQSLDREALAERADFVFSGWPSKAAPAVPCKWEMARWWVHKVYKGDKTLEGKVVAVVPPNYALLKEAPGQKAPSYAAHKYKDGILSFEQSTSFLFTQRQKDGCFELAAEGAQEPGSAEAEIEALFAPQDCLAQKKAYERKVDALPRQCAADADCKLFALHPNSCERPVVLRKDAPLDREFLGIQTRMGGACGKEWAGMPSCQPKKLPFRCRAGRCEEGYGASAPKPRFTKASMGKGCAPHDGPAVLISAKDESGQSEFSLSWWKNRPSARGGEFRLSGKAFGTGYAARFCPVPGACKGLKAVEVRLRWEKESAEGLLEFSFTTEDGDTLKGIVPVAEEPAKGILCG